MRNRIQKSMIFVVTMSLLISYILVTLVIYRQALDIRRSELVQEAEYIRAAIDISGEEYFGTMDKVSKNTRVTWIDKDGKVLYDTGDDQETLANHKSRKEFKEALANGSGQDIRMSDSKGQEMYYYALKMDDSSVLRVSKGMDTVWNTAFMILPYMIAIGVMMACVAWFMTRHQVKRLIAPINNLDLEEPLENDVYEELHPLLERIDRQNKEKAAIEQMRREFSANVSHELKTPLTSISGYAEIMMNGLVKSEDMQGFSERIYKEASRMITLVGDIIKLSKLDEGSVELEKENVDLYQMTREIVSRLALQAEKRRIQVEVVGEHVECFGIRQILDEMIYNICENAIKYNKPNGKIIATAEVVNQTEDYVTCRFMVKDPGIGMSDDFQKNMFDPFSQEYGKDRSEFRGTELELSIVKRIVDQMGGEIRVESKKGVGTTFTWTLTFKTDKEYREEREY